MGQCGRSGGIRFSPTLRARATTYSLHLSLSASPSCCFLRLPVTASPRTAQRAVRDPTSHLHPPGLTLPPCGVSPSCCSVTELLGNCSLAAARFHALFRVGEVHSEHGSGNRPPPPWAVSLRLSRSALLASSGRREAPRYLGASLLEAGLPLQQCSGVLSTRACVLFSAHSVDVASTGVVIDGYLWGIATQARMPDAICR